MVKIVCLLVNEFRFIESHPVIIMPEYAPGVVDHYLTKFFNMWQRFEISTKNISYH